MPAVVAAPAIAADLPADLAAWRERRGMHVYIRAMRTNGGDDLGKLARDDHLASRARVDDIRRPDLPRDRSRLRAEGCKARHRGGRRCGRRLAKPDDDAAVHPLLCEVDVRLLHRALQAAEAQLVLDEPFIAADGGF